MTLPLSLTGKYQLVVLASEGDSQLTDRVARLDRALDISSSLLGVNLNNFLIRVIGGGGGAHLDRGMPTVAVFFGSIAPPRLSAQDVAMLDQLLADGSLIIPIVEDATKFTTLVPPQIAALNGLSLPDCGAQFERLASRILEGFGLLREKRRLFISYRRIETSGVAAQLYEALDAAGFDVFLDTHGVLRPGEPFQDILWHRLADTDVALLLDSPCFLATRGTLGKLARPTSPNIRILQLLGPG